LDSKDYYSSKLRAEIDEHNGLLYGIEKDTKTNEIIKREMKAFISAVFGNDGWIRLVEARWLRAHQNMHEKEYDPNSVKIYV
jgi:hypothetical protein